MIVKKMFLNSRIFLLQTLIWGFEAASGQRSCAGQQIQGRKYIYNNLIFYSERMRYYYNYNYN